MDRYATFELTTQDIEKAKQATLDSRQGVVRNDGSL